MEKSPNPSAIDLLGWQKPGQTKSSICFNCWGTVQTLIPMSILNRMSIRFSLPSKLNFVKQRKNTRKLKATEPPGLP